LKTYTQELTLFVLVSALILAIGNSGLNTSYSQGTTDNLVNPQLQDSPTLGQCIWNSVQQNNKWNQTLVNEPENILCDGTDECGGIV